MKFSGNKIHPLAVAVMLALVAGCSASDKMTPVATADTAEVTENTDIEETSGEMTSTDQTNGDNQSENTDQTDTSDTSDQVEACFDAMTFFLTSVGPGDGGNLGGLPGADIHCTNLAEAAGSTGKTWRAYLSTTGDDGVDAKDRIGDGPWYNANGVLASENVANLLSGDNNLGKDGSISERGEVINASGDSPNRHDIITGTEADGTASEDSADTTCGNWTSNSNGAAIVGHHDKNGGGANPTSWSSAHKSRSCSLSDFRALGGDGLFYCFAIG